MGWPIPILIYRFQSYQYWLRPGHPEILFGLRPKCLPKMGSLLIIVPVTCITLTKVEVKIVQLYILVLSTVEGE